MCIMRCGSSSLKPAVGCTILHRPGPATMSVERARISFLEVNHPTSSLTCRMCSTAPFDPRPLPTYLLGRYSRCLSRKWWPTNMRACSIAIPSARSLSYTVRNASELILPRRRLVASSSVMGAEVSSTLLVFGLYQCMRNAPFPFPKAYLDVYLRGVPKGGFLPPGCCKIRCLMTLSAQEHPTPPFRGRFDILEGPTL
jgi:hypothetical protein